ncbi:hypothetical protein GH714_012652 [Hevea brasiliensis]|uniref:Uncharacterized protein n=1 Tax=Hevea brasiliensis TaxID=3981 RepID=A0A6A6NGU6_HEVBR|nr:hypothetical protein GH714_012652 [Hevea brasiliensis]
MPTSYYSELGRHGSSGQGGMSPFETVYGRPPPNLLKFLPGETKVEAVAQTLLDRDEILRQLQYNLARAQQRMVKAANKHRKDVEFQPHLSADEHIGTGRIQLQKALSQGYDDASWPLQSKSGRHSGEVRLILHNSNASNQHKSKLATSGPQYAAQQGAMSQVLPYDQLPPAPAAHYPATTFYSISSPYTGYPPNPATYLPSTYLATPPTGYPPQPCPPAGYPPNIPASSTSLNVHPPAGVYPPPPSSSGILPTTSILILMR